jgi:hypothetical protein
VETVTTPVQQRPESDAPLERWESWLAWLETYYSNYTPRCNERHQAKINRWRRALVEEAEEMIAIKRGGSGEQ